MGKNYFDSYEVTQEVIKMGIKKGNTPSRKVFLLGMLAGVFIGLAYVADMTVMQNLIGTDKGLAKFMGAAVFPVGIMLVLFVGGSLFTGNNLIFISYLDKKIKINQVIKNWVVVWLGNLAGSILIAGLAVLAGVYHSGTPITKLALDMAHHKMELGFTEAIVSGFLCNILVALGVWMALGGRDLISKLFAAWFPIMLFALSGYQHSVANMYCLSLGKMLDPNGINIVEMFTKNILPVSLGNLLAGGIFLPVIYYYLYGSNKKV